MVGKQIDGLFKLTPKKSLYGYPAFKRALCHLALLHETLEMGDDDVTEVVAFILQHLAVSAESKGRHSVVALRKIVDGGNAVRGFCPDRLTFY